MAAGQGTAGALQPGHADRAQAGGKCSSAVRRHRPGWQCGSGCAAAGPLGRGKTRSGEHGFPVQADALDLVRPPCGRGPRGFTMRPTCPCGAITWTSCCQQVGQVEHLIHVLQPMVGQRRCQWLVVANDHVHTQRHTPALRFGTGGGGRQVETGMASELDGHRADTAGSADHQQVPAGGPAAGGLEGHAAELQFPSGWGPAAGRWIGPAPVWRAHWLQCDCHPLLLRVAAGAGDVTGVTPGRRPQNRVPADRRPERCRRHPTPARARHRPGWGRSSRSTSAGLIDTASTTAQRPCPAVMPGAALCCAASAQYRPVDAGRSPRSVS